MCAEIGDVILWENVIDEVRGGFGGGKLDAERRECVAAQPELGRLILRVGTAQRVPGYQDLMPASL